MINYIKFNVLLMDVHLFNTYLGSEFNHQLIIKATEAFAIKRSLSAKRFPYDKHQLNRRIRASKSNLCTR